ncbi:MAG: hypothetical protein IID36_03780 [Planctomycetes bacterium]|nr:hypothetical protein [Planctomycetota bacterium]
MASPTQSGGKICAICHEDCSSRARTKDRAGRYYCQECFDAAMKKKAARKKAVAAPPPPPADDGLGLLEDFAAAASSAPGVELADPDAPVAAAQPMHAHGGGVARPAGANREVSGGVPEFIKQPWFAFVAPTLILGVLYLVARGSPDTAVIFLLPQFLFSLVAGVLVLIQAFRTGIVAGILTFCLFPYTIYFAFAVNDNPHIKALFGVSLISSIPAYIMIFQMGINMVTPIGQAP